MSRSRSAVKSQEDQDRRSSSVVVSPPADPDPEDEYIIPGRLKLRQWSNALIQEEAEDVVGEIMTELLSLVMDGCLKSDLQNQVVPFTVSWAKSYLIQVLQQKFICRDENEEAEESSKTEDSLPTPSIIDNWAQGCFPILQIKPPPVSQQGEENDRAPEPTHQETRVTRLKISPKQIEKELGASRPDKGPSQKPKHLFLPKLVESKHSPSQPKEKKDIKSKKIVRSVSLTTQSSYQQKGSVMPKLDVSSLPKQWIVPQCQIVNQSNLNMSFKKPGGHFRKESEKDRSRLKPLTQYEDRPGQSLLKNEAAVWLGKSSPSCQRRAEFVSAESVDLAKRVSLMAHRTVRLSRPQFTCSSGFS